MTTLLAAAALALLFVAYGLLASRGAARGACHRCAAHESPELCASCALRDTNAREEEEAA